MSTALPSAIQLSYLVATCCFIVGLKRLGSPATARQGNTIASVGMLIAIVATLLNASVLNYGMILAGLGIGSVIGVVAAQRVAMTAMPQMVALLNGLGGAASGLVAIAELWRRLAAAEVLSVAETVAPLLGIFIGGLTLTGSLIAFAKLQTLITGKPIIIPLQRWVSLLLLATVLGGSVYLIWQPSFPLLLGLIGISLVLGLLFVLPVGGADMPVVISLLNSFSGLAASAAGFVLMNNMLIISGALVGASGLILTQIMCKGMNRSLTNVLFSAFNTASPAGQVAANGAQVDRVVRSIDAEEGAMMLGYSRSVVIVPGYGMAVAQAQHSIRELADLLENKGIEVKYAIHPVAGRMPGHMNVLLAEANVPYPQLYDMEDINPEFERVDVALVIGANDVVNPMARHDPTSPIYGMPILDVDRAKQTIVIKRSMQPGYAGIDNELFYQDKTVMFFGSARDAVMQLVTQVKQL